MSEAVASLEGPHTPCTPHTPGLPATPNTPGTGHKSPHSGMTSERNNKDFTNDIKTDFNLEDLNFDPAAIIGDNNGDWNVSEVSLPSKHLVLKRCPVQLNNMDPNDLLSFLDGPGELATPPSSGAGGSRL